MNAERSPRRRVLVVEDDPDFAALLEASLRGMGYDSEVASDADRALDSVRFRPPDAVTLDIQMPGKSGCLFYRQMKKNPDWRAIPVIVVTGLSREDPEWLGWIRSFLEVEHLPPPEAYLEKPLDADRLKTVLQVHAG